MCDIGYTGEVRVYRDLEYEKQHLDQNRAKLINQINTRTFKQHVLAKKVPNNPKKSQVSSLKKCPIISNL